MPILFGQHLQHVVPDPSRHYGPFAPDGIKALSDAIQCFFRLSSVVCWQGKNHFDFSTDITISCTQALVFLGAFRELEVDLNTCQDGCEHAQCAEPKLFGLCNHFLQGCERTRP